MSALDLNLLKSGRHTKAKFEQKINNNVLFHYFKLFLVLF